MTNKDTIEILQTSTFVRKKKKLKKNQIKDLDLAVKNIIANPEIGTQKKGDLRDVWFYKFLMVKQETLLAYQWEPKKRILIALSMHENFYRDLERSQVSATVAAKNLAAQRADERRMELMSGNIGGALGTRAIATQGGIGG